MPGHFESVGCYGDAGMSRHFASYARGAYHEYEWPRSPIAFDFPMDAMTRVNASIFMTHDDMVDRVENYDIHWHGQIYRNYEHGLDAYLKFAGDPYRYKYELVMPPISTTAGYAEDDPYPAPCQYYMATGKIYKRRYTPEEWAALGTAIEDDPVVAMVVEEEVDAAMNTTDPTGDGNTAMNDLEAIAPRSAELER